MSQKYTWCKHYRGAIRKVCSKGITYTDFNNGDNFGIIYKIPCRLENVNTPTCEQREFYTDEENIERKRKAKVNMAFTSIAIAKIIDKENAEPEVGGGMSDTKKGSKGVIECPACKGVLRYSVSGGNHHIWGKCETKGCLAWMM